MDGCVHNTGDVQDSALGHRNKMIQVLLRLFYLKKQNYSYVIHSLTVEHWCNLYIN